jgi:hypothetical protein
VDSRLGAQLDLQLDRRWSAVLQVVSEQNLDRAYRPRIDWANVKYQLTPDLALRAGRIALPVFLAADYRKVGYAYAWVRPPVEIYGAQPLDSSDGADLTWRFGTGQVRNTTQAFFGRKSMGLTPTTRLDMRHMTGISQTAEYGPLTARLSALTADVTLLASASASPASGSRTIRATGSRWAKRATSRPLPSLARPRPCTPARACGAARSRHTSALRACAPPVTTPTPA